MRAEILKRKECATLVLLEASFRKIRKVAMVKARRGAQAYPQSTQQKL
jgi:hypothetical protein